MKRPPRIRGGRKLSQPFSAINLRRRREARAPEDPDSERNAVPTELHRGVFPGGLHRNEHTFHNPPFQCARALHRSGSATADRCQTSRPATLSCKRWLPCPPDPASLPHRARGYKVPPPAPDRPAPRDAPTICLGRLSFASYPLSVLILHPT